MSTSKFDPDAYKRTTREQWQVAAEPWYRWGPTLEEWLGEATELMLDLAHVGPGDRVLDVAAGAGGQTLAAARRVEAHVRFWRPTSRRTSSSSPSAGRSGQA